MVGDEVAIRATFAGDDRRVYYKWSTQLGQLDPTMGEVMLVDGDGETSATWTAPAMFASGRVVLEASYHEDFTDSVTGVVGAAAHQQFGILETSTIVPFSTDQLIATPVEIPEAGFAVSLSVKASGMGRVLVGIYADNGGAPASLLAASTTPLTVDGTLDFETIPFGDVTFNPPRVWLAVLVKPTGTIQLANVDIQNTGQLPSFVASGVADVGLPSTFPTATADQNHYGMFVTVKAGTPIGL